MKFIDCDYNATGYIPLGACANLPAGAAVRCVVGDRIVVVGDAVDDIEAEVIAVSDDRKTIRVRFVRAHDGAR